MRNLRRALFAITGISILAAQYMDLDSVIYFATVWTGIASCTAALFIKVGR